MRSDLVFKSMSYVSNRYLLTRLVAKATRKLHRPNTRIEETTNDVLERFGRQNPMDTTVSVPDDVTVLRNVA